MEAKEKAKELVIKFRDKCIEGYVFTDDYNPEREMRHLKKGIQCALIAVNEIIEYSRLIEPYLGLDYWQEVKQEIEKL